jgi:prepilin-type N-terminal cleavage/methylation domain-containing protein/prepilin-type processing-associated H-X9-DG protein
VRSKRILEVSCPAHRGRKAFTLIELLVVIAIIALLLAILLPTLQRVRKQARAAACQATLRQWGTTLALYLEEYDGRFPRTADSTVLMLTARNPNMPTSFRGELGPDANRVTAYHAVRTKGLLCPMATKAGDGPGGYGVSFLSGGVTWKLQVTFGTTFQAWVLEEPGPPLNVSYGLNRWLFDRPTQLGLFAPPPPSYTDVYSLRRTAGVPLLLDSRTPYGLPKDDVGAPVNEDGFPAQTGMTPFCINRHNGRVNGLFLDWSVRKVGLKELWTLKWHKDFNTAGPWTQAGDVQPDTWPPWMRKFKGY